MDIQCLFCVGGTEFISITWSRFYMVLMMYITLGIAWGSFRLNSIRLMDKVTVYYWNKSGGNQDGSTRISVNLQ
jgi:hypothetical protein